MQKISVTAKPDNDSELKCWVRIYIEKSDDPKCTATVSKIIRRQLCEAMIEPRFLWLS